MSSRKSLQPENARFCNCYFGEAMSAINSNQVIFNIVIVSTKINSSKKRVAALGELRQHYSSSHKMLKLLEEAYKTIEHLI